MKRKHDTSSFQKCVGLGVPDASVRAILKRLGSSEGASKSETLDKRFPELLPCLLSATVSDQEVWFTDLEQYVAILVEKSPDFKALVQSYVLPQVQSQGCVKGVLYLDECTPGNPVRPDNERKSYCVYFAWLPIALLRKDWLWMPVSVLRHEEMIKLESGVAMYVSQVLKIMEPFFRGCCVGDKLVPTGEVFLLADEAALKAASSAKGAAGLRPCLKCHVVSKDREGLEGYASICSHDESQFTFYTEEEVVQTVQFLLESKRNGMPKTKLEQYEKLAGWHCDPNFWLMDADLRRRVPWSHVVYDALHVLWSNGIVGQELSLFFQAANIKAGKCREQLESFLDSGWRPTSQIGGGVSPGSLKKLAGTKLLKANVDYKGDADQSVQLLSLLSFFAEHVLLPVCPSLQPEVASLLILCDLCNQVLDAKQCISRAQGITDLVSEHMQAFVSAYSVDLLRPKAHFAFHLQAGMELSGGVLDCFTCERKNKTFKGKIAPQLKKLTGFSKSSLLRFLEMDCHKISEMPPQTALLGQSKPIDLGGDSYKVAKEMVYHGVHTRVGNFLLFDDQHAYKVEACLQGWLGCYILPKIFSIVYIYI